MNNTQVAEYLAQLNDKNKYVRIRAIEALGHIRDVSTVPALISLLNDKDDLIEVGDWVILALGIIGDASAVPILITHLKEESLCSNAAYALERIGDPSAIPALTEMLQHPTALGSAACALGNMGAVSAVPTLITMLRDTTVRGTVRMAVIEALGNIGDASAAPILIAELQDETMRIKAARALGKIGDVSAVPALTELLEDKDQTKDAREWIAFALGQISRASNAPALSRLADHIQSSSPEPFASYPYGGRQLIDRVRGANCRHEYGLRHQQITGQTNCAYCGMSLVDTYEHWLMMAYDHVVPASVCAAASIRVEWIEDIINRVLCCAACNGFKNRWKPEKALTCPATLEAFVALRDKIFKERKALILASHEVERRFYESRPWEKRIDV